MLITQLKSKEAIKSLIKGKTVVINCHGCKEVYFPEQEADEFQKEMAAGGNVAATVTTDYICSPDHLCLQLKNTWMHQCRHTVLVFSCGVGVQTVAAFPRTKRCTPAATPCRCRASRA